MIKKILKLTFILFTFILVISSNFVFVQAVEEPNSLDSDLNKIYSNAKIDENFKEDSVLIVVDEEYSQFKDISNYVLNELEKFNLKNIHNLIELSSEKLMNTNINSTNTELATYYEKNSFNQIIEIQLNEKNKSLVLEVIKELEKLDFIKSASPNYIIEPSYIPSEPNINSLWGIDYYDGINCYDAWDIERSKSSVRVGVMDTGIATHEDLDVAQGYDTYNENNITNDDLDSHGTHVAGTIGARINSIGICGVAPNVTLVPLQITHTDPDDGDQKAYSTDAVEAIEYAINLWDTEERISILNYSFGGFGTDTTVLSAVKDYPGLFVWAAGNDGDDVDSFTNISQFRIRNLISVGAINGNRQKWTDSNYGYYVDLFAPGVSINSTVPGGYAYKQGTSMAAPHVTGVAALLLSYNSNFSASAIKQIMIETSLEKASFSSICYSGILDAYESLAYAEQLPIENNYYFIIDRLHQLESNATTLDSFHKGYTDSYSITAPETVNYSNSSGTDDTRAFSYWGIILNGPNGYDSETNPWIEFSTNRTLTFNVKDIIEQYYPFYEVADNIYIRAFYKTPVEDDSCIAEGSKITLANGKQKKVEDLTGDEMLLVWNLHTGTYDVAPILCIDYDEKKINEVITLKFSDGTKVEIVDEHAFFDSDLNKYVYLDKNARDYIGHHFIKQGKNKNHPEQTKVELVDVSIKKKSIATYSPVTYSHLCYYVDGMLSIPGGINGLFNIFEVDSEMLKYDAEQMSEDINKYGLFTYEEFNELIQVPREIFDAVQGQYLKIAIAKGLINLEELEKLILKYSHLF